MNYIDQILLEQELSEGFYIECNHDMIKFDSINQSLMVIPAKTNFFLHEKKQTFVILSTNNSNLETSMMESPFHTSYVDRNFANTISDALTIEYYRAKKELGFIYRKLYSSFPLIKEYLFSRAFQKIGTCNSIAYDNLNIEKKVEVDNFINLIIKIGKMRG